MSGEYRLVRQDLAPEIGVIQVDSDTGNTPVVVVNTSEPIGAAKDAIRAFKNHALSAVAAVAATIGQFAAYAEIPATPPKAPAAIVRDRMPLVPVDERALRANRP